MKVLAISSSPRKNGNSDVLCDRFLKGAAEAGHDTEKIRLAEKKITPCLACDCCLQDTHTCAIKDDMASLQQKMTEADAIVLASPVYFYSVCSQMKIFIDRCLPHYRDMQNKQFYFIVTAADPLHEAADGTIAAMRGFLKCLPGAVEKGIVYGTGTWDKGDVYKHPSLNKAYEMGKEA